MLSNAKNSLIVASAVSVLSIIVIIGTLGQPSGVNTSQVATVISADCTTPSELVILNENKLNVETQIADINKQINLVTNDLSPIKVLLDKKNKEIVTAQNLILSEATLAKEKKKVDDASSVYLKLISSTPQGTTLSRSVALSIATSKSTYNKYLGAYNKLIEKNESNKSKLASLNADKLDLEDRINSIKANILELNIALNNLNDNLNKLNSSIENGVNNPCQTNESFCADGIDNDKDGILDCTDIDCSGDIACTVIVLSETSCSDAIDNDNDGYLDCSDSECSQDSNCIGIGGTFSNMIDSGSGGVMDPATVGNSMNTILCDDSNACNYGSTDSPCEYSSCMANRTGVCKDTDECSPPGPVDHGVCTEQCVLSCDPGYSVSKTFLSAVNPFGRDRYVCSEYVLNSGICGGSLGSCPNQDYPLNVEATNNLPIEQQDKSWICGTHKCTL